LEHRPSGIGRGPFVWPSRAKQKAKLANCISNDWQFWPTNYRFLVKQIFDQRAGRPLSLAETYRPTVQGLLANNAQLRRRGLERYL